MNKKQMIEDRANAMLDASLVNMKGLVKKALNSGSLDIDSWDPDINPMIIPKIIVKAVLHDEANGYGAEGTCFEKQVKKEVKNLMLFL